MAPVRQVVKDSGTFHNMMNDCNLEQVVDFPTRNNNILDILFTNNASLTSQLNQRRTRDKRSYSYCNRWYHMPPSKESTHTPSYTSQAVLCMHYFQTGKLGGSWKSRVSTSKPPSIFTNFKIPTTCNQWQSLSTVKSFDLCLFSFISYGNFLTKYRAQKIARF